MMRKKLALSLAIAMACVPAFATVDSMLLRLEDSTELLEFFESGDAIAYGSVVENANTSTELIQDAGAIEFIVKANNGDILLRANGATGVCYLRGEVFENQATLTPSSAGELLVKDGAGVVVALVDQDGNLKLTGELLELGLF